MIARVRWWEVVAALGVFLVLFGILCFPVRAGGGPTKASACVASMKRTAVALMQYASDADDRLPLSDRWVDGGQRYAKDGVSFRCPSVTAYGYAYNAHLSGHPLAESGEPGTTPMAYDSTSLVQNAADRLTSLPKPGRHHGLDTIGYLDGHAKMRKP